MSIQRRTPADTAFGEADVAAAMFPALTALDEQSATRQTTCAENPGTEDEDLRTASRVQSSIGRQGGRCPEGDAAADLVS
jgi:hypothetical protein